MTGPGPPPPPGPNGVAGGGTTGPPPSGPRGSPSNPPLASDGPVVADYLPGSTGASATAYAYWGATSARRALTTLTHLGGVVRWTRAGAHATQVGPEARGVLTHDARPAGTTTVTSAITSNATEPGGRSGLER